MTEGIWRRYSLREMNRYSLREMNLKVAYSSAVNNT